MMSMLVPSNILEEGDIVAVHADANDIVAQLPDQSITLIVTSPPYNLGKEYERTVSIETYLDQQARLIPQLVRVLHPHGSICWQVGHYVERGEVYPLDILYYPLFKRFGLKLRNRIIWRFGHG